MGKAKWNYKYLADLMIAVANGAYIHVVGCMTEHMLVLYRLQVWVITQLPKLHLIMSAQIQTHIYTVHTYSVLNHICLKYKLSQLFNIQFFVSTLYTDFHKYHASMRLPRLKHTGSHFWEVTSSGQEMMYSMSLLHTEPHRATHNVLVLVSYLMCVLLYLFQ